MYNMFSKHYKVKHMANIRDVATKAGTSITTVSKVLSNDPTFKVTESTRESIYQAVKDLNYVFNKKSKSTKKFKIGCIMAMTSVKYADPYFTSILSGIEEEAKISNCNVSYHINYDELENPKKLEEMYAMNLDGLIIMETLPKAVLHDIMTNITHVIAVDNYRNIMNSVGFDHFESTKQVMKHLIKNQYKRIAYIGGGAPNIDMYDTKRLIMYRESLRIANLTYDDAIVKDCYWDLDLCAIQTNELLNLSPRPDVIFAGSDSLAQIVLGQIHKNNLRCPDDIAVVGFNNLNFSSYLVPALTTIDVPSKRMGQIAVKRIVEMIQNDDQSIYSIILPTELIKRESTREVVK